MRALKILPLAALTCALALAAAAGGKGRGGGGVEIKVGQEKRVKAEGGELRIAFDRVAEDSRCPEGAKCVWQGNARVRLVVWNRKGECAEFDLNTGVPPSEYRFGDYTIRLAGLAPYPAAGRDINVGDYRATVVVSKTK